jgi:hypothetical protein
MLHAKMEFRAATARRHTIDTVRWALETQPSPKPARIRLLASEADFGDMPILSRAAEDSAGR